MADIKKLKYDDKDIYPITHIEAIVDDNEEFIKDKYVTATKFEGTNNFIVPSLMPEEIRDLNARVGAVADDIQSNTLGTLIDKVGDLNNLQTSNKANAVSSINEVISNSESLQASVNTKLDKTIYNNKIATLTQNLESVNTATNNVKQRIVNTLKNNDINASNTEGFDSLINKVQSMNGKSSIQYGLPKFINIYNYWTALASIGKTSNLEGLNYHIMIEHNNIIHIFGGVHYNFSDPSDPSSYDYNNNYTHYGFDVNTGTLTTISTNERYFEGNDAVIYNNSIYVYGSYNTKNDTTLYNGMFAYDINTRSWSTKKSGKSYLYYGTMEIVNNKIYTIGGYYRDNDGNYNYYADNIKMYDPVLNSFTDKMNINVYDHTTTVIGNDIYLFGGQDVEFDNNLITAYKYSTTQNKLTQLANLPIPLFGHSAIDFDNKYIYLIGGGSSEDGATAEFTYRYNIEKNNYSVYESESFKYPYVYGNAIKKNKLIYACGGLQWLSDNLYTYPGIAWAVVDTSIEGVNAPSGTETPSVEPLTIMSDKYYSGTTQFRTNSTYVSYSYESGLTMKPSTSTSHIWAALNTAIDLTYYTNVKLTFQCGVAGLHKFMIGARASSGYSGTGTSTPTFDSGTSEVISTITYGTSAYYVVNIDIRNLIGAKYLTLVACYDQSTVYYSNGIYITDFVLE